MIAQYMVAIWAPYKRYLTVKTDNSLGVGTSIIFSWGAPERLNAQLSRIGTIGQKAIWIDPLAATRLPGALRGADAVERIEAVLALTADGAELSRYSLPDLYSLSPPTAALMSLMPGLKLAEAVAVPVVTSEVLGKKLAACDGAFRVVIDTPGDEGTVLDFLDKTGVLDRVTTLALRCGVEPFFKNAAHINNLLAMLATKGFSIVAQDKDEDSDWPVYVLKLDIRARLIKSLEVAGAQAQADLAAAREEQAAERDAAKAAAAQAAEAQTALKADLEARTKERDAAKAVAAQRETTLAKLRLEQKRATALNTEKALRLEHELYQLRSDLRRAAQAQERSQAETDALKLRYGAVQEERQGLLRLLQQLTPKLREAAKHVREIPVAKQSDVTAMLEGAKSGKAKKKKRS